VSSAHDLQIFNRKISILKRRKRPCTHVFQTRFKSVIPMSEQSVTAHTGTRG